MDALLRQILADNKEEREKVLLENAALSAEIFKLRQQISGIAEQQRRNDDALWQSMNDMQKALKTMQEMRADADNRTVRLQD